MRARCRARAEAIPALKAAPLRLTALLLRQARRYTGRATWSPAQRRWLREGVCPPPAPPSVFPEDVRAVTEQPERLARVAQARTAQGQPWRLVPVVAALHPLRGGQCTGAGTTGAARGALTRCEPPRQLRHALGCTPSASSPGARRRQGGRPQTGHRHARRALGEGAWASRAPATVRRHRP